ncbi:Hypothetical predicted protein [Mytilus galloprovincialis]|uniref:Reverse transcriptase domain-containing protein n=1 Tax=Mytilus galloprovincialis TaxID=29158 RepID=A0A8B6BTG6_MYTGA|nr:Hypothetical predicted protein [Mytilus galloprovincialis]
MKPPKRLRKPKGMTGKSPNKKKKTQGTLPELAEVTDKETVPFQADIGSISVASGSDQPEIDQNPRQHMASVMAGTSSRGYGSGWAIYDEQYRLGKARCAQSSWAELDMELWVMYVSTPPRFAHSDTNSFGGHKGSQYVQNQNRYKDPRHHARVTTSVDVLMGQHVNLNINVSGALETTLLGPAKRGKDYELYSLGYSPICVNEVKESLKFYPYKVIANELIHGLRFGFKLQYSGSRLPVNENYSKSVTIHADLVREKINKEITLGRMAGPFDHPPLPTLRISPIFLAEKKNGDYRLIHNLSYPLHDSVQYSGIDDAVRLVQNIGKLSKSDVKSAFRLLRVSPSDFDQLGFIFYGKYYFDRCLPQGASISCSLFEKFSTALHWVTELTSGNSNILHYLDDFFLEVKQIVQLVRKHLKRSRKFVQIGGFH